MTLFKSDSVVNDLAKKLHRFKMIERQAIKLQEKIKKRQYFFKEQRRNIDLLQNSKIVVNFNDKKHSVPYKLIATLTIAELAKIMQEGNPKFNVPARPFVATFLKSTAMKNIKIDTTILDRNISFAVIKKDIEDKINNLFQQWIRKQNTLAPLSEDYLARSGKRIGGKKPLLRSGRLMENTYFTLEV